MEMIRCVRIVIYLLISYHMAYISFSNNIFVALAKTNDSFDIIIFIIIIINHYYFYYKFKYDLVT